MLRIRPARKDDLKEIMELARLAGIGMSSLPQDETVMSDKIRKSALSFEGKAEKPGQERFLFVLEDADKNHLAGTVGIVAHVGMSRPFYSYKLSIISQASTALGIYSQQQVLHMVNDYNGATEVGSLFLHPDYRGDGNGKFLSRSRLLMLAEFPQLFSDTIISEIRGVQEKDGSSPFYENLAKHFFQMDFKKADYIYATQGTQFIADLMPKYPIYVNMLTPEAQAVIGVPLDASKPAMQMLTDEGFRYEGYVDLFDAGPTIQAWRERILTVRDSVKAKVVAIDDILTDAKEYMVCNTRLADFSVARTALKAVASSVAIDKKTADLLGVKVGDDIRYAE